MNVHKIKYSTKAFTLYVIHKHTEQTEAQADRYCFLNSHRQDLRLNVGS